MSTTLTCADCATAAETEWWIFKSGCRGCCARAAARSPQYFEARKEGRLTPKYRALLDQFQLTHDAVKEAAARDALKPRQPATITA